jgi:hypothetical protein
MLAKLKKSPVSSRQKSIGGDRRDLLIGLRPMLNSGSGAVFISLGERKLIKHFVVQFFRAAKVVQRAPEVR